MQKLDVVYDLRVMNALPSCFSKALQPTDGNLDELLQWQLEKTLRIDRLVQEAMRPRVEASRSGEIFRVNQLYADSLVGWPHGIVRHHDSRRRLHRSVACLGSLNAA